MRRVLILTSLVIAVVVLTFPASAQSIPNPPGKWFVQTGVFFPNQQYFQQTYTFQRTVYTQKLQISYSCTDCVAASIDVSLPDGTLLMPSIWFDGTVQNNIEWTIYPTNVDSIILTISTEAAQGLIRVNVMGTDTRSATQNKQ